jgi:hypothetical protein
MVTFEGLHAKMAAEMGLIWLGGTMFPGSGVRV